MGRLKAYKRLFKNYALLGFREPYQVVVDAQFVEDTIKLEAQRLIEKALHGKVKMMITSCCIRVLYAKNKKGVKDAQLAAAIERAKSFERVRCGHMMDQDPLPPHECLMSVMNHKGKGNKYRYCLATQDEEIRRQMREIPAVPLIYEKRSVIILEPMSESTQRIRQREEVAKYRDGLKSRGPTNLGKRKREDDEGSGGEEGSGDEDDQSGGEKEGETEGRTPNADQEQQRKKKKHHGRKGPNPLAVKKAKKRPAAGNQEKPKPKEQAAQGDGSGDAPHKKRKRKKRQATGPEESDHPVTPAEMAGAATVQTEVET